MTDARSQLSTLALFAGQELTLAVRSRWTSTFAIVFTLLGLGVGGSGYILTGGVGMQDFSRTAASLVQLVLLLVPLTALLMGVLSLATDRGAAELLFAQPVPRSVVMLGKLAGLFEALAAAQLIGLGAAGLVIFAQTGSGGMGSLVVLAAGSLVLTAVFLGLAAVIAAGNVGRRARALALALVTWFVAVVLFDVAVLGVASLLRSGHASRLLVTAVLVNPVDAVRTATLLGIEGDAAFGAASLAFFRIAGGRTQALVLLAVSLAAWLVVPVTIAARRLRAADL